MTLSFHPLKVIGVRKETEQATTIFFEIPEQLAETFRFTAGQYLTLRFLIDGKEHRRAYSICTCPNQKEIGITSKKVNKGVVSNFINTYVKVGQTIEVLPPEGKFTILPDPEQRKDYYFVAAGSGITPIFSMIKTILEEEPKSCCYLLFGNRDEHSIIYEEELKNLLKRFTGQLFIDFILSQPFREKSSGMLKVFKKAKISWQGLVGRINDLHLMSFLNKYAGLNTEKNYFICGPGLMIASVKDGLLNSGIKKENIFSEHFTSAHSETKGELTGTNENALVKVQLEGQSIELNVPKDKSILEVLIENDFDPPYSCTSGACSTCVAKIISGKAKMEVCYGLDDEEIEAGFILTCQAHPTTNEMEIVYQT